MNCLPTQFATSMHMDIYDRNHQGDLWEDAFKSDSSPNTGGSMILQADVKLDYRSEDISCKALRIPKKSDQEANKPSEKVLRRLAQNREAARKSRLRKKAYVQQLESSRIKLVQLEQELERTKQQCVLVGGDAGDSSSILHGTSKPGIAAFEKEYAHWVEEQNRQISELRTALQAQVTDIELQILVESGMKHYEHLFQMKSIAAASDIFYLISGQWRTPTERFFLWIGGFRPSEIVKVLTPLIGDLTEKQIEDVFYLQKSSLQAEDALSQGMERLQQTTAETLTSGPLIYLDEADYNTKIITAMGKLEALISFLSQADHIRHQSLLQMQRILTTQQAARVLLALGNFFQGVRALSTLWAARPRETT